jgi:hypothetical protein
MKNYHLSDVDDFSLVDAKYIKHMLDSNQFTQQELDYALRKSVLEARIDISTMLLEHGADIRSFGEQTEQVSAIINLALVPVVQKELSDVVPWIGHDVAAEVMSMIYVDNHHDIQRIYEWAVNNARYIKQWDISTCSHVAKSGHLEVLKWLHENKCPISSSISRHAAEGGHLNILQWLYENGYPFDIWTCARSARGGHLEVLQWLHENGCPWDKYTCAWAAEGGHLEVLQWARANGCPWDASTCASAAYGGHLEVLQWARANGCPWDSWTCANAAEGGHLEVLQWAHENGCPWDEETCAMAALSGNLTLLQWARSQGCPWDQDTCTNAVEGGHLEILKWARAHGCPFDRWGCEQRAHDYGRHDILEWVQTDNNTYDDDDDMEPWYDR